MKLLPMINTEAKIPKEIYDDLMMIEVKKSWIGRPLMDVQDVVAELTEMCGKEKASLFKPEYFCIID